jgi:hypothetical protein
MKLFSIYLAALLLSGPDPAGLNGCIDQIGAAHMVLVQEDETVLVVDLSGSGEPEAGWVEGACLSAGAVDQALTRAHRASVERLIHELSAAEATPDDEENLHAPTRDYH